MLVSSFVPIGVERGTITECCPIAFLFVGNMSQNLLAKVFFFFSFGHVALCSTSLFCESTCDITHILNEQEKLVQQHCVAQINLYLSAAEKLINQ